jgi:putative DNA primase/helicase
MAGSQYSTWRPSAQEIAAVLGAEKRGRSYVCRCPVPGHVDKHPSFYITERDGRVFVQCKSGCSQDAVLNALRARRLWPDEKDSARRGLGGAGYERPAPESEAEDDKPRDPLKWWRSGAPVRRGSPVDVYLASRGIETTGAERAALRFRSRLWHWPSQTTWPCMLALVQRVSGDGLVELTCHMTFLDGRGGKAPIERERLFPAGASPAGGGVWFGASTGSVTDPNLEFIVAEGIESTLSAMRIYGAAAGCAALSALGIERLILPPAIRRVRIFADRDELGQGFAAATIAARRWTAEGRKVVVSHAREVGEDANDVLLRRLAAAAASTTAAEPTAETRPDSDLSRRDATSSV